MYKRQLLSSPLLSSSLLGACAAIVANTGKAGLNLERGEGEKRAGGGKRRVSILDGWKIHRTSIQINFGHAVAIGDVII